MNAFINPTAAASTSNMPASSSSKGSTFSETSFLKHLEGKKNAEKKDNLLGVKDKNQSRDFEVDSTRKKKQKAKRDKSFQEVASLISRLLQKLKDAAGSQEITQPGQWDFSVPDLSLLEKIGQAAGMSEADFTNFMQNLFQTDGGIQEGEGGSFNLQDFLAALAEHFQEMSEEKEILLPETDLPFLEMILARMGVPPEDIEVISASVVTGDDKLNLVHFLEELQAYDIPEDVKTGPVILSEWEVEQLQDVFNKAGVSEELQQFLLGTENASGTVIGFNGLKEMLSKAVHEVKAQGETANIPAFLADLNEVLIQAGFDKKSAGWTPVVLESISETYNKLLETVDFSTVQIKSLKIQTSTKQEMSLKEEIAALLEGQEEVFPQQGSSLLGEEELRLGKIIKTIQANPDIVEERPETLIAAKFEQIFSSGQLFSSDQFAIHSQEPANLRPLPYMLQQQVAQQISQGVFKGIQTGESHLVLRLQPPELGEVKVDLLIKDEKVSVTFMMENSKVKEVLQSNLDQFRSDLEQKGFSLDQCNVSVGQHDKGDAGNRFEIAWDALHAPKRETLADLPEDVLYLREKILEAREGGISLFV